MLTSIDSLQEMEENLDTMEQTMSVKAESKEDETREFDLGDQVMLVGTSDPGQIISAVQENGRIHVRFDDGSASGRELALKPEKLKHVGETNGALARDILRGNFEDLCRTLDTTMKECVGEDRRMVSVLANVLRKTSSDPVKERYGISSPVPFLLDIIQSRMFGRQSARVWRSSLIIVDPILATAARTLVALTETRGAIHECMFKFVQHDGFRMFRDILDHRRAHPGVTVATWKDTGRPVALSACLHVLSNLMMDEALQYKLCVAEGSSNAEEVELNKEIIRDLARLCTSKDLSIQRQVTGILQNLGTKTNSREEEQAWQVVPPPTRSQEALEGTRLVPSELADCRWSFEDELEQQQQQQQSDGGAADGEAKSEDGVLVSTNEVLGHDYMVLLKRSPALDTCSLAIDKWKGELGSDSDEFALSMWMYCPRPQQDADEGSEPPPPMCQAGGDGGGVILWASVTMRKVITPAGGGAISAERPERGNGGFANCAVPTSVKRAWWPRRRLKRPPKTTRATSRC